MCPLTYIQCRVLIRWLTYVQLHCPHCMGSYEGTGAADFVLPSRVSYYAHTYSVVEVRQPRNLYGSTAHVRAHHACHCLHFGDVLPTISGSLRVGTPHPPSRAPVRPSRIHIRFSRFNRSIDRCAKHRSGSVRPSTP